MNAFYWLGVLLIADIVVICVYKLLIGMHDRRLDEIDPVPERKGLWARQFYKRPRTYRRIIFENLIMIALGGLLIAFACVMHWYEKYGAFYGDYYKYPGVEEHLIFDAKDNDYLEKVYEKDPEGFTLGHYNIVLVKMGCEDCERMKEEIKDLQNSGYLLVFTDSKVGRLCREQYHIANVPCVIEEGAVRYIDQAGISTDYGDIDNCSPEQDLEQNCVEEYVE